MLYSIRFFDQLTHAVAYLHTRTLTRQIRTIYIHNRPYQLHPTYAIYCLFYIQFDARRRSIMRSNGKYF